MSMPRAIYGQRYPVANRIKERMLSNRHRNNWDKCQKYLLLIIWIFFMSSRQYLCAGISTSQGGVIGGGGVSNSQPLFLSRSEAFKFVIGETISLPCEVSHPGQYLLAWKRGIAILTAGNLKVTPDPRVRLFNGYTLQIKDATEHDAGDYICQIATQDPREITHHVEILVPPKIHKVTSEGHLQVKKGSPVRLECSASGNPTPNITWTRKNNILPNGEDKYVSQSYVIENMDRHKGGVYICTANNGVGQIASSQIILHVLYAPEITTERPIIYTGEGQEAVLGCIVHGESQPEVLWFKDTMQIDTTERHIIEHRGSRHTLIIRKVHTQDFGNYSCVAENQMGKARKTITLSGKPNVATFISAPTSQWRDRYNISWTVQSHAQIEEYKLYYRALQNPMENTFNVRGRNFHSYRPKKVEDIDVHNDASSFNVHNDYLNTLGVGWPKNDWRDVILPAMTFSNKILHSFSYVILGLEPDQQYEAKVQSRNRYGWSNFSESFVFTTSNTDTVMRGLSVTHYSSSSGTASGSSFFSSALSRTSPSSKIIIFSLLLICGIPFVRKIFRIL